MVDSKLLEMLGCPVTKTSLVYKQEQNELWAKASGLSYPIRDGIPVMLPEEARKLTSDEQESLE